MSDVTPHPPNPPNQVSPTSFTPKQPRLMALGSVCVCVDSLHFLLALYGYFGAVGRLTLYTLPSIVKDRST